MVWLYGIYMVKVTFTLDERTIRCIEDAARRLGCPKSAVIRESVQDFHQNLGRLSETERQRMLRVFDELVPAIPKRSHAAARREQAALRRARRSGGRRSA